MNFLDSED